MTKIDSMGFQGPGDTGGECGDIGSDMAGATASGSLGVKCPSSRSLSYSSIVPSACETRKRFGEEGTHRMAVHGELQMRPYSLVSFVT